MSYGIHAQLPDCGGTSYLPWVKHKDKRLQSWRTNWFLSVWQLSNKQALWSFSGKVYNTNLYKTKKEKLPSPQLQYLLLYTGDSLHDEKNLFLKLIPVQYGDGGRFPYRGGPLPTLVMGRTSVELFRFSHRNCKKNKSEWAHEFFRQEGETSLLKSSDHSPLVHIVHLLCGCVWSPPTGQSGVLWLLQGTL